MKSNINHYKVEVTMHYPLGMVNTYVFRSKWHAMAVAKAFWRMLMIGLEMRGKFHWVRSDVAISESKAIYL